MNNGWKLKELNHKELIEVTNKSIIAPRGQDVAKTAQTLRELRAIFESFVLKMFSILADCSKEVTYV